MTKLLIVEDEVQALAALRKGMIRRGYVVETAATAPHAIATGRLFKPDILLTDWLLVGEQGGLQVATELRRLDPRLSIVFVTGLPIPPLQAAAASLRPWVFLAKPVRFAAIEAAMQKALSAFPA